MSTKIYGAPWGIRVKLITGMVGGIAIIMGCVLPFVLKKEAAPLFVSFLPSIAVTAVFGGTALFVVRRFELTDQEIHVQRSVWKDTINLSGLRSATADATACKGAFKTFGNDGLFAMHGRFYSKKLGKFRAFVTDRANAVILKFDDRTIVISPENPRSFVNELNRRQRRLKEHA